MSLASEEDIERFAERVREELGDRVERVILFGSYATDEYVPGSDVDVAVILSEVRQEDDRELWDIAEDFRFEEDLNFSPKIFESAEFDEKVRKDYSFYNEVSEKGVEI